MIKGFLRPTVLVFTIAILALATFLILMFQSFDRQSKQSNLVFHTYEVKLQLMTLHKSLLNIETGQRGFLVTNDTSFLRPYYRGYRQVDTCMKNLYKLVGSESHQKQQLSLITQLTTSRTNRMKYVLKNKDAMPLSELTIQMKQGRMTMDSLRTLMNKMIAVESDTLKDRLQEQKLSEVKFRRNLFVLATLAIFIIIASLWKLFGESKRRNITDLVNKQLEENIAARTTEITQVNELLVKQNEQLEKQNKELNSFNYVASHDLKEPLRKISVFINLLEETEAKNISTHGQRYFDSIRNAAKRMTMLLEDLLSYARTGHIDEQKTDTDLNAIVARALDTLKYSIDEKHAQVHYSSLPIIPASARQMEQLFTNLIANALKYAKEDVAPEIHLSSEAAAHNYWNIVVQDNGIGFEPEYKDKIFEVFQRLHGQGEYSGSGIGLAICKKIVEQHGGTIEAFSEKGEGAKFIITLPAAS